MRGEVGVGVYSALFLVLICTRMVTILVCEICACVWAPLPKTAHFHNLMIIKENNGAPGRIRTCDLCLGRQRSIQLSYGFPTEPRLQPSVSLVRLRPPLCQYKRLVDFIVTPV